MRAKKGRSTETVKPADFVHGAPIEGQDTFKPSKEVLA
jgi:hypothetical protein